MFQCNATQVKKNSGGFHDRARTWGCGEIAVFHTSQSILLGEEIKINLSDLHSVVFTHQ